MEGAIAISANLAFANSSETNVKPRKAGQHSADPRKAAQFRLKYARDTLALRQYIADMLRDSYARAYLADMRCLGDCKGRIGHSHPRQGVYLDKGYTASR